MLASYARLGNLGPLPAYASLETSTAPPVCFVHADLGGLVCQDAFNPLADVVPLKLVELDNLCVVLAVVLTDCNEK